MTRVHDMSLDLAKLNEEFSRKAPKDILSWATGEFYPDIAVSSSFGHGSAALLHMVSQIKAGVKVIFIDSGYHFPETLAYRDKLQKLLGLNIVVYRAALSREEFIEKYTDHLYSSQPNLCCEINKVEPMRRALDGLKAWISGIRRGQTEERSGAQWVERYEGAVYKVNPLLSWTSKDVWEYIKSNGLPVHPLFEKGYKSIGCWPCTRPVLSGEDERAGRWAEWDKRECGIHTFLKKDEPQKGQA